MSGQSVEDFLRRESDKNLLKMFDDEVSGNKQKHAAGQFRDLARWVALRLPDNKQRSSTLLALLDARRCALACVVAGKDDEGEKE